jgi:hypothetical protein
MGSTPGGRTQATRRAQGRAEEHKRRAEFVNGLIENWEEANRVRTFVMALTEAASKTECSDEKKQEIRQVLDWTTKYADLLDPLTDLPTPWTSLCIQNGNILG